jgi:hypothetical protein
MRANAGRQARPRTTPETSLSSPPTA